jgi:hypothetical protein
MAAVDYLMQKSQRPSPVANTDALEAAVAELRRELAALRADIVVDALTARADRAEAELAELRRRTAQMEAQLEGKGIPRYLGIWKSGLYTEGSCVTDHGSVLVCSRQTDGRPGQDDAWTLAVKRGADGRSAVSPRPSGAAEPRP